MGYTRQVMLYKKKQKNSCVFLINDFDTSKIWQGNFDTASCAIWRIMYYCFNITSIKFAMKRNYSNLFVVNIIAI